MAWNISLNFFKVFFKNAENEIECRTYRGLTMANIVTAKELGQYLKLSESTIYKLAAEGELPGFKIGDSW